MSNQNLVLVNSTESTPALGPVSQTKDMLMSFVPLLLVFGVFYFFILRPQINKQKQQDTLIKSVKKGDRIVVAGGIIGKIIKEQDSIITIEISKNATMDVLKSSIVSILGDNAAILKR